MKKERKKKLAKKTKNRLLIWKNNYMISCRSQIEEYEFFNR